MRAGVIVACIIGTLAILLGACRYAATRGPSGAATSTGVVVYERPRSNSAAARRMMTGTPSAAPRGRSGSRVPAQFV